MNTKGNMTNEIKEPKLSCPHFEELGKAADSIQTKLREIQYLCDAGDIKGIESEINALEIEVIGLAVEATLCRSINKELRQYADHYRNKYEREVTQPDNKQLVAENISKFGKVIDSLENQQENRYSVVGIDKNVYFIILVEGADDVKSVQYRTDYDYTKAYKIAKNWTEKGELPQ